ncbi:hypothetical protein Aperf_G00000129257 [Anoplocephala perfoliata]
MQVQNKDEEVNQKLCDLPIESVKRICSFLSFKDLLRACSTFPGWNYVLSLPYNEPLIANNFATNIQWIDGYLCRFISTGFYPAQFVDDRRAVMYYTDADSKASNYPKPNLCRTLKVHFVVGESLHPKRYYRHAFRAHFKKMLERRKIENVIYRDRRYCLIEDADIVIYAVYGTGSRQERFEEVVEKLSSHQILLVVRFRFRNEMEKSNLQCLSECYECLEDFLGAPGSPNWRIWIMRLNPCYNHLLPMFEWACSQLV